MKQLDAKSVGIAEGRLHVRQLVKFMVRLVQGGRPIANVQVVDMSPIGLGVECSDVVLSCGQRVEVHFSKGGHPFGVSCCIPAVISRIGTKSVGLMLERNPYF